MAQLILDELSHAVLAIGELLDEVFVDYDQFGRWVIDSLPMEPSTAQRIRAMHHLHGHRPGHPDLPEPWTALRTLSG